MAHDLSRELELATADRRRVLLVSVVDLHIFVPTHHARAEHLAKESSEACEHVCELRYRQGE